MTEIEAFSTLLTIFLLLLAVVSGGWVADTDDAFARYIGWGGPALGTICFTEAIKLAEAVHADDLAINAETEQ